MIDLTNTAEVVELLNRAVAEKGADYEYPRAGGECFYFEPDGTPSCLIGNVLAQKGVKLEDFVVIEDGQPWDLNSGESVFSLDAYGFIKTTGETQDILTRAQRMQDDGYSWGEALDLATMGVDY
jgi:hypothetical protein